MAAYIIIWFTCNQYALKTPKICLAHPHQWHPVQWGVGRRQAAPTALESGTLDRRRSGLAVRCMRLLGDAISKLPEPMIIGPKNIDCKFPFPWNFHWWHGYFCSLSLYVRYGLLDVISRKKNGSDTSFWRQDPGPPITWTRISLPAGSGEGTAVAIIDSGVSHVVKRQKEGWSYIRV